MKRQLIAWIVLLAFGLQGSMVAFAAIEPEMQRDCQTSGERQSDMAHKPCCPSRTHTVNCCLDVCVAAVAITASSRSLAWHARASQSQRFRAAAFSSRGDSPSIRPPIL